MHNRKKGKAINESPYRRQKAIKRWLALNGPRIAQSTGLCRKLIYTEYKCDNSMSGIKILYKGRHKRSTMKDIKYR